MGALNKVIACKEVFSPLFFKSELDIQQWLREHYGSVFESGHKETVLKSCLEQMFDSVCFHRTEKSYTRGRVSGVELENECSYSLTSFMASHTIPSQIEFLVYIKNTLMADYQWVKDNEIDNKAHLLTHFWIEYLVKTEGVSSKTLRDWVDSLDEKTQLSLLDFGYEFTREGHDYYKLALMDCAVRDEAKTNRMFFDYIQLVDSGYYDAWSPMGQSLADRVRINERLISSKVKSLKSLSKCHYDLKKVPEDQRLLSNKTDESLAKASKILGFNVVFPQGEYTHELELKDFEQKIQDADNVCGKFKMYRYLSRFVEGY